MITAFGKTQTAEAWAEECNSALPKYAHVSAKLIRDRISRGMDPERAVALRKLTPQEASAIARGKNTGSPWRFWSPMFYGDVRYFDKSKRRV